MDDISFVVSFTSEWAQHMSGMPPPPRSQAILSENPLHFKENRDGITMMTDIWEFRARQFSIFSGQGNKNMAKQSNRVISVFKSCQGKIQGSETSERILSKRYFAVW